MYCITLISKSLPTPSQSSHHSADHVVLNLVHSDNFELTNQLSLSSQHASLLICHLQIDHHQVLLHSHLIIASKCIFKLGLSQPHVYLQSSSIAASQSARLQPPRSSTWSHKYGIQFCTIMASKCIPTLARLWPRSLHDDGVQVHLHTGSNMASKLA